MYALFCREYFSHGGTNYSSQQGSKIGRRHANPLFSLEWLSNVKTREDMSCSPTNNIKDIWQPIGV